MPDHDLLAEYKRREFLQLLGSGAALTLPVQLGAAETLVRVRLERDGTVLALTGKVDMGQGARTLLTQCVAEELRVPAGKVRLLMGDTAAVPDDGGTWASLTTPETVPIMRAAAAKVRGGAVTPPSEWKVLGRSTPNVNGRAIVTGALRYASDLKEDGMWHGVILRPPSYHGSLVAVDASKAAALPEVKVVREGEFLGVAAPTRERAAEAARLIEAQWKEQPLPALEEMFTLFRQKAAAPVENNETRYPPLIRQGDAGTALAAAARRNQSSYTLAPVSHVPLETRSAIASFGGDGSLTIRTGKQAPFLIRGEVAKALGIEETKVRLIVSEIGGGFGSKQRADVEIEAARLARACGRTVRVHWSRAEEFVWSAPRPAALIEIESGVDANGRLSAWRHRNYNAGAPGLKLPYSIPHHSNEFWRTPAPLRQGSYRSLAATGNNFARESHIDEWAHLLKRDPLEFRLANIEDSRLKEALEKAAALFGWKGPKPGVGLACNLEKNARLALFVELDAAGKEVKVRRMAGVGDFGAALNPSNLQAQFEGALIQGLGGALFERFAFDARTEISRSLADYRLPRFSDLPEIKVEIIDRRDIPAAGAGESPITLPAPAIAAALFTLTGERKRALPLLG